MSQTQQPESDALGGWVFFRNLKASRLMAPADVEVLERQARTEPLATIQRFLVDEGYLTDYQLSRIRCGQPDGLLLGQYRIVGELGRGGFGQVYKAEHALMGRTVAVKVLSPDFCQDPATRDLFVREVVTTTRLSHPNIAAAFDANEVDGKVFFVMEYVDGLSLEAYVREHGLLSPALACTVLTQTAHALQHAQESGLVHRDLKPANIMLAGAAKGDEAAVALRVKVIDFGLASLRTAGVGPVPTLPCHAGAVVGTPSFIPPEQIADVHAADTRSDLYSLGCTLYYALCGRLPFDGPNTRVVLLQHLQHDFPPLESRRPDVPAGLTAVVHKLMARSPADRYQTPGELIAAVAAFAGDANLRVPQVFGSQAVAPPPRRVLPPSTHAWAAPPPAQEHTRVTRVQAAGPPVRVDPPNPVHPANPGPRAADLRPLWEDWCAVVEDFAAGRTPDVTSDGYRELYRELTAAVRDVKAGRCDGRAAQLARLETLVEPWVTAESLADLDERMLAGLWRNCQAMTAALWPAARPRGLARWVAALFG